MVLRELDLFLGGQQRSLGDAVQIQADCILAIDAFGDSRASSCCHVAPFVAFTNGQERVRYRKGFLASPEESPETYSG